MKGLPKKTRSWEEKRNRGRNIATTIPVRIVTKVPKPPSTFTPQMRATWKQTAEDLIIMGVFTTQSLIPLESYCYAIANMRATQRDRSAKTTAKTAAVKECRV